jgi:hypothetical protein
MKRLMQFMYFVTLFALASSVASAHMQVTKTAPEDGATLAKAPESVQVWFSQEPKGEVSKMTMTGPNGEVELFVHPGGDKSLMGMVQGKNLGDGAYVVTWESAGDDGALQNGEYEFTVKSSD